MNKRLLIMLSLMSGLLLSLAWPAGGFPALMFVAFVPLLWVEEHFAKNRGKNSLFSVAPFAFITFLTWNLLTTWWIVNSTTVGAIVAVGLNAAFMTLVFTLFHFTRRSLANPVHGYITWIFYWISFELLHHHWELNWPWLSLGNAFASYHTWIQWYEYTGIFGGTLWVMVVNLLVLGFVTSLFSDRRSVSDISVKGSAILLMILVPIIISWIIYRNVDLMPGEKVEVVVIQPNLDPYVEQYELPPLEVVDRMWNLATAHLDSSVQLMVCPESAIQEYVWEEHMNLTPSVMKFREYLAQYPGMQIVIGLSSRRVLDPAFPPTPTARKFSDVDLYYDRYNTAMLLDTSQNFQLYHKSKLTPGVEAMPLLKYFKFLENFALDLGGTVGSLGKDPERIPFKTSNGLKAGTAICYESVFGEFMTGYVRNGANLILVITNDGWWGNTAGHRQHLLFSKLRAVEMRRAIARSANTGISCFVNLRGDIEQPTSYWKRAAIRQGIYTNNEITFYVRYGDYIARASVFGAIIMMLITVVMRITGKIKR